MKEIFKIFKVGIVEAKKAFQLNEPHNHQFEVLLTSNRSDALRKKSILHMPSKEKQV